MNDYSGLASRAEEIALSAAKVAYSYFRQKALLIEFKEDKTPVTVADRKTEEKIRELLLADFPEHGILGEEFGVASTKSDFVWTVDPIDGTKSFIRGVPLFGTLLGLLHRGEPVVGVVVMLGLDEVYVASKGKGATCNGERIHVSNTKSLDQALVSVGDRDAFEGAEKLNYLERLWDKTKLVRGYADCFGHCLVMRGAVDAMVDPLVMPWDIAPIACLVKEAGGDYFSFDGKRTVSKEVSSFISCTPAIHNQLRF